MAKTVSKSKSRVKSPGRKQAKPVAARRKIKATRAPRKGAKKRAAHRFVVSHHNEADFQEGLRSYASTQCCRQEVAPHVLDSGLMSQPIVI